MEREPAPPAVERTHLSDVFLSADRAFKLLRPVDAGFVDFTDTATRLAAAATEFELNKRLSPDVYLGLADVVEDGELADRLIVMRRLPAERRLDRLIDAPGLADHLREVARRVAAIHAAAPALTGADADVARHRAIRANWDGCLEVLEPTVGSIIPTAEFRRVVELVDRYLTGRAGLFDQRVDAGWVRDGHGDLRAEHVFCLDDGPRLIDCLAFRDDYRIADVLADVAFLAMDLHRLAGPAAAAHFVALYDEFADERHPSSLAHHYVAYRAAVRAKVAAVRFGQGERAAAGEILAYHQLALQHLEVGQPRLIMVGGGAATGKSTVASALADRLAATWLRADEIRKNLAGLSADEHAYSEFEAGIYSPDFSDRVYAELLREAELLLARGESVVLDASWSSAEHRRLARELGERTAAAVTELVCTVDPAVARERIARRMASLYNPSDATPDIADRLLAAFDQWPEAARVGTGCAIVSSVDSAYGRVMAGSLLQPLDGRRARPGPPGPLRVVDTALSHETIGLFLSRVSSGIFVRQPADGGDGTGGRR